MSWGLYAQNGGQIVSSAEITTEGAGGFGVFSDNQYGGGETKITLNGGSVTTKGGANAAGHGSHGVISKYAGSTVEVNGTTVRVEGDHAENKAAAALLAEQGGLINVDNAAIETDGTWAFGLQATGGGEIAMDGGSITTNNAKGKGTQDGNGSRAYAIYAKDADSSIETTGTTIVTQGQRAYGAYAIDGGNAELTGGSITTHGFMGYGVYASGADSTVTTNNVDITTSGQVGDAIWAYNSGVVTINGGNILVQGGSNSSAPYESSYGARALGGNDGDGIVNINNASIVTLSPNSYGVLAGGSISTVPASGTVNLNKAHVEVRGAGTSAAGTTSGGTLTASNGTTLIALNGNAIEATNNGTLTLNGTTTESSGATIQSNFNAASQVQDITVGADSSLGKNDGTLLRVDRKGDGVDGVINMTLQSGSYASGNIRNYDEAGDLVKHDPVLTNFVVQEGAVWAGIFIDPGTSVVDGDDDMDDFTTGEGEDVAIDGTGGGTQNFNGTTNIGGSVSVGRDVSFNGPTTIGNDLHGQDGTSTSVQGPATIGGSVNGGAGSSFAFSNTTSISGGVAGADGSDFSFNGDTNIGGGVEGNGSSMTFGGPASIGGGVSGQGGASFSFSQTGSSSIGGDVNLGGGSSIGGGSMNNPINVGGNAVVGAGSALGGNLNVAGSLSGSGGTFAPGNSIGTQTYGSMGSFTGTYVAEVNAAGLSDLVTITSGNADLTGIDLKVSQENGNGGYKLYHDYAIVKTGKADGISAVAGNKFASEALDDTFAGTLVQLDPVKYGSNDVKISLSVDGAAIDRTGYSANQSATLDGALSVAGRNASADAVMFMQPDARKDALNQLSGELHGSTQAALLQSSSLVSRTLTQRLRANLGAGMLPGAPTAQAGGSVVGAMPTSAAYPLWAQVVGNWSTLDSDGNAAQVKTDTAGLFIGGDTEVGAGWRVGGALGYTDGRIKVDERDSKSDVSTFTAALYGGNSWKQDNGTLNFLAGAAYSHHDIDSRRTVNVGGSQTLKADYRAHTTQLFTELGYAVPVGRRSVVEPYLGLAWLSQKAKGFTEEGGAAALQGESQKDDVTTFTLGLRGKTALEVGAHPAHVFAGLGWRHASGDVDPGRRVSFVQGGGAAFNVAGAPIAKNAAVVDLGVEMAVGRNTAMGLGYSGQYGNDNTDHSGQLYLRSRF
ncbi:autotransporter domain-containing protein [Pusillimonas sp.]|uniref:autotransporter domain-containing protein n=1 Tax=Pusillimonas sp. TaxID=3040095 RepID=UPI0029B6AB90|nr:autotransporter domain-containing protein [Pusillimonas sp.]MDX3894059.1 autotransporter domain-containing protein [Pusillimonas sp.]